MPKINLLILEGFEEIITAPHELSLDEHQWYSFPVMLGRFLSSDFLAGRGLRVHPFEWDLLVGEVLFHFYAEWAVIGTDYSVF